MTDSKDRRKAWDLKTIAVLVAAVLGSGGITGWIQSNINPNIQLQNRINVVEEQVKINEKMATANTGQIAARTERVERYIESHKIEEELRQKLIDKELDIIKDILSRIEDNQRILLGLNGVKPKKK